MMKDSFELDEEELSYLINASENTFHQLQSRMAFLERLCPDRLELMKAFKLMLKKKMERKDVER